jgi:hypothetical protein
MTQLLEKGKVFIWTQDCQASFEELKKHLTTALVLVLPDLTSLISIVMLQGEAFRMHLAS